MAQEQSRTQRLTKRTVDAAHPGAERYTVWDAELKGFGLRVSPTGTKTFVARYRAGGGRRGTLRQHVLGRFGVLTADEARDVAKKVLAAATRGEDPQAARASRRAELTVGELCDLYLREGVAVKKASTIYIDRGRIERHIKPVLGSAKVTDLTKGDVERLMRDVAAGRTRHEDAPLVRGGKGAASRVVGLLSGILGFAVDRGLRPDNPAKEVARFRDGKRDRFLSPAELGALGEAFAAHEEAGGDWRPVTILRLLALTGARKNEIARLTWQEVDLERGLLRLIDSKTGAKVIPLGAAAAAVLDALRSETKARRGPVFPDLTKASEPYRRLDWAWVTIRRRAGLDDVRIHDLRHSFASAGLASGQALPLIGKLLGHSQPSTTSRYAHLADDPVKAAADKISGAISGALAGVAAEVVDIRKAKA